MATNLVSEGKNNAASFNLRVYRGEGMALLAMTIALVIGAAVLQVAFRREFRVTSVWRPLNGTWYILRSDDGVPYAVQFGLGTDVPVPGDYDGDGRGDVAVFRPSDGTWHEQRSTSASVTLQFGMSGDKPAPNAFVYRTPTPTPPPTP